MVDGGQHETFTRVRMARIMQLGSSWRANTGVTQVQAEAVDITAAGNTTTACQR
jgi:hypothetical protein